MKQHPSAAAALQLSNSGSNDEEVPQLPDWSMKGGTQIQHQAPEILEMHGNAMFSLVSLVGQEVCKIFNKSVPLGHHRTGANRSLTVRARTHLCSGARG